MKQFAVLERELCLTMVLDVWLIGFLSLCTDLLYFVPDHIFTYTIVLLLLLKVTAECPFGPVIDIETLVVNNVVLAALVLSIVTEMTVIIGLLIFMLYIPDRLFIIFSAEPCLTFVTYKRGKRTVIDHSDIHPQVVFLIVNQQRVLYVLLQNPLWRVIVLRKLRQFRGSLYYSAPKAMT